MNGLVHTLFAALAELCRAQAKLEVVSGRRRAEWWNARATWCESRAGGAPAAPLPDPAKEAPRC